MSRVHRYKVTSQKVTVHVRLYIRPGFNRGSLVGGVYHQGKRFRFSLGHHHINPEHWDSVRQRMFVGSPDCDTINQSVDQWVDRIILYYTDGRSNPEQPTISGLRSHLFPSKQPVIRSTSPIVRGWGGDKTVTLKTG
jgi:hypothetical protein